MIDRDPGQSRLELLEGVLDPTRHIERVRPRELLDDQHHARAVVDDRLTDERLVGVDELDDVGQREELAVAAGDRDVGQVLDADDRRDVPDHEALVRRVDEATGPGEVARVELEESVIERLGHGVHDRAQRDALLGHLGRRPPAR